MSPGKQVQGLSPLGKSYVEPSIINRAFPGSPEQEQKNGMPQNQAGDVSDAYNLSRIKMTTDANARQKKLYANNIEKTLDFIDPKTLAKYSGLSGSLQKLYEKGKSSAGESSEDYQNYSKSAAAADFLAKQVRQFYGDSITPEMDMRLRAITNPSSWSNDPKLTEDLFNQFKDILHREIGTYTEALRSPSAYGEPKTANQPEGNVEAVKVLNGNPYHKINGKWYPYTGG